VRSKTLVRLTNATNNIVLQGIADPVPWNVNHNQAFRNDWYSDNFGSWVGDQWRTQALMEAGKAICDGYQGQAQATAETSESEKARATDGQ